MIGVLDLGFNVKRNPTFRLLATLGKKWILTVFVLSPARRAFKEIEELWVNYDLELEGKKGVKDHLGVKVVLSEGLNTPKEEEPIEIIEK